MFIRPWRSWISQQIPILEAGGSNPSGRAKTKILSILVGRIFVLYYSFFIKTDFRMNNEY